MWKVAKFDTKGVLRSAAPAIVGAASGLGLHYLGKKTNSPKLTGLLPGVAVGTLGHALTDGALRYREQNDQEKDLDKKDRALLAAADVLREGRHLPLAGVLAAAGFNDKMREKNKSFSDTTALMNHVVGGGGGLVAEGLARRQAMKIRKEHGLEDPDRIFS